MAHAQNGPFMKWSILRMGFFKNGPIEKLPFVGNDPTFKLLLMKKKKVNVFASLCKIIRQLQASIPPLCHKTIQHSNSNQCVFRAMQTDEFGVSDFIGSSL